ncbi:MAG: chemotaxis protein CheW, partial [Pseudomonadota bacterium]|nr:chemotaxis protein CheW [Pseudomonadota bacterium]
DVVRSNIERIGGTVEIDSTPGRGTRMTLRVPLTLTIIPALTVSIGVQHFAIPRTAIEEIVRANGNSVALDRVGGSGIATIRGRRMPKIALADLLGLASDLAEEQRTLVVLRPAGGDLFALAVDHIHDHEELVVKPAAPAVMATGLYAGTTLADDGSPILLFDPAGLAEQGGIRFETQDRAGVVAEQSAELPAREMPVLLFRGLDGTRRALPLGVVDRIEEIPAARITLAAGQLRAQVGETILPLAGIPASHPIENKIRILRLSDGHGEIGYAVAEVIDLTSLAHDIIPVSTLGGVYGVVLIGGEPAELLDAHWLFAEHAAPSATKTSAVCRLSEDDPWMQNMLRPIVESAGYRVVSEGDDVPADLTIAFEGGTAAANSARTIWLRSDPEGGARPDSIYRYDRDGLLAAIRVAGSAK